jgi:hypothetical protein
MITTNQLNRYMYIVLQVDGGLFSFSVILMPGYAALTRPTGTGLAACSCIFLLRPFGSEPFSTLFITGRAGWL